MPVIPYDELTFPSVAMEGADKIRKEIVIGESEGWIDYVLRVVRIGPGGYAPAHRHDWEHVNYVISGRGRLRIGATTYDLATRDFAFVPANEEHQFSNPHDDEFEFICIVPSRGEY